CPRPRPADGTNCARVDARPGSVPRLNGAVTAQRAIPTAQGRDIALRCPRPRPADGTNCARVDARPGSVPRLNGAVTAQRAIPTNFGFRVYWKDRR
ncbi:MAG: hypothetical protein ABSA45_11925, partial [Verrucomicrobiota bacterium]